MAIFMKYGALDGEVTAKGYEKWIELRSVTLGVGRGISTGPGGGSKREATAPSVSEIMVTKTMDVASPHLLRESVGGKAVEVKIELTQTDNKGTHIAYQKYVLTDTLISSYSIAGADRDRPDESLSLNFTKFDSEYLNIDDKFASKTTGHVIYDLSKATSG